MNAANLQMIKIGVRIAVTLGIACWFILGLLAKRPVPNLALMQTFKDAGIAIGIAVLAMLIAAGPRNVLSRAFWR